MHKGKKKRPSTRRKGTKNSGLAQVIGQIKSIVSEKCHQWRIGLYDMARDGECITLYGHTMGRSAVCPCCGKRSTALHSYRLRKIQCTEWLGHHTTLVLETRHMIYVSASACIRVLRLMGKVNPEVRTSGYVGMDDFAKWKGHKYMCAIVDHYTREVLAVFDSRYGQEIIDWLKSHPEIKVVTRDGSQSYASIITAASSLIMQISDRFHLMHNLKKDAVEPIKALLGQKRMKQPYPYPSEDEAYWYIMEDILEMGDARHRKKVRTYYDVRRLKDEGKSIAETARHLASGHRKYTRHWARICPRCSILIRNKP